VHVLPCYVTWCIGYLCVYLCNVMSFFGDSSDWCVVWADIGIGACVT
jgi:hypothetical protein